MSMETLACYLDGQQVECTLEVEPYIPDYTRELPEDCYPSEVSIGDIEKVTFVTMGFVPAYSLTDERWHKFDHVVVDITDLLTREQMESLTEQCYIHFRYGQTKDES